MTERDLDEFFKRNWRGHVFFAKKMLPHDLMAAEDAVNVAYAQGLEAIREGKFDDSVYPFGRFAVYIRMSVVHKIYDYEKIMKRGRMAKENILHFSKEAIDVAVKKSELLNNICNTLSGQQSKMLDFYLDGYSYEDISNIFKVSINTCRIHINRALNKIAAKLGVVRVMSTSGVLDKPNARRAWCERQGNKKINPYAI